MLQRTLTLFCSDPQNEHSRDLGNIVRSTIRSACRSFKGFLLYGFLPLGIMPLLFQFPSTHLVKPAIFEPVAQVLPVTGNTPPHTQHAVVVAQAATEEEVAYAEAEDTLATISSTIVALKKNEPESASSPSPEDKSAVVDAVTPTESLTFAAQVPVSPATATVPASPIPTASPAEPVKPAEPVIETTGFNWPIKGRISQNFSASHTAIDIEGPMGSPIGAAMAGTVTSVVRMTTGYGLHVFVSHGNGYTTLYSHLSQISVVEGQSVAAGETVGLRGMTGRATGPHVHFEIRKNGNKLNPLTLLQ